MFPDHWCNEFAFMIINVTQCIKNYHCCNDWPSMQWNVFRWIKSAEWMRSVPSAWGMLFGSSLKYMGPD
eukprot:237173-Rhodomonas_salina.1